MQQLTREDIGRIRQWTSNHDMFFYLIPSPELCEMVIKNEHPCVKSLPSSYKILFAQKTPVYIDNKMVLDYIEGKLDTKNSFILSHGEIRVIDNSYKIAKEIKK